jgi:hypothetical protein
MNHRCLFLRLPLVTAALVFIHSVAVSDELAGQLQPVDNVSPISEAVKRLRQAKGKAADSNEISERIRESTWRLLVGDAAASSDVKMFSTAVDASRDGLAQLNQIDEELKASEDLQRKVAANPQVAMRLDLALNGRQTTEKNIELSRAQELLRLKQLREINREYRALIEDLLASQTEILLGNANELNARLTSASEHLKQVEVVVGAREDFYLFSDEPNVEDADGELEVVVSLAKPYSTSTQLYQRLVTAHAQLRAAMNSIPVDQGGLRECLNQLSEMAPDEVGDNSLFHYLRGIASMELALAVVGDRVWNLEAHNEASQLFADAKVSLQAALSKLPDAPAHRSQRADVTARLSILSDEDSVLSLVQNASLQHDEASSSLALLETGVRAHASARLFLTWVYSRWQAGLINASAAISLLKQAESASLLNPNDEQVILTTARITTLDAWNKFQGSSGTELTENLGGTKAALQVLVDAADVNTQLEAASLAALLEVMISASNEVPEEAAKAIFMEIGATAAELEARWNQAEPEVKSRLANAVAIARLAEGYLAVRFASAESNRAQLAFAAAAAISAKTPRLPFQPYPNAELLLRTMLTRDDAANLRLAMTERDLRMALQKSFPSVVTSSFNSSSENTASLVRDAQNLISSGKGDLHPSSQLDPRELASSQLSVRHDSSSVAAFSLLNSKQPAEAITLLLQSLDYKLEPGKGVSTVQWSDAIQQLESQTNPLMRCAFAESLEYYAADSLESSDPRKTMLLKEALLIQQRLASVLVKETFWGGKWPFLKNRVDNAISRLTDASGFLKKAAALRLNMELSAARQLLSDGAARFPENAELRIEFVQTLLDESETNPGERDRLLKVGVAALSSLPPSQLSSSALLKAAELHEQLGNQSAAMSAYEAALNTTPSVEHSLIARSRLSSLRLSLAAK